MNPSSLKEVQKLLKESTKYINIIKKTDVVICPPFVYLENLKNINKKIKLGAQNVGNVDGGSYTGEISVSMLKDFGVKYVIVGHSERRELGETNLDINKKIKLLISSSIVPILCIGERERDENHEYFSFIKEELEESLKGINKTNIEKIIIAYEPIWAIGSNAKREATPYEFREILILIKKILSDNFGAKNVSNVRIIYGGSANPGNVLGFLKEGGAHGFLVGRASLNQKKFLEIIKLTENAF